uniref:DJ-1/PfpI domain-containing protein n=1 Tax=Kalanchoe fedtschenkoi TaxID=63787 RepID=A0A7N0TM24_KALFE
MGSVEVAAKSALILCGDYMEDSEAMVPFHFLQALGVRVHCASKGKLSGHKCLTAIHDFVGFELYSELPGHNFVLNATFAELSFESYDMLIIPGGRFTEVLSDDEDVVGIVKKFAHLGKPVITSCHSQIMLVAAGLAKGRNVTGFWSLKPVVELAGGTWVEDDASASVLDLTGCVVDGNILSTIGWPAHAEYLSQLVKLLGGQVQSSSGPKSVLFLCGDFVEDYEMYVPYRALEGLGCKVDAVSPNKKKGDTCVTAVWDDEGAQIWSEKRGHNFYFKTSWDEEIRAENYDCLVVPGGRSPELLLNDKKAVALVQDFAEKDKIVAGVGHGLWLLAAADILRGKTCAASHGVKVIAKAAGAQVANDALCTTDRKLVTAVGWHALPQFVSELADALGLSVVF